MIYCLGPLSHYLAIIGVELALVAGCEFVTHDGSRGQAMLDRIISTGATYVMGVPTHAIDIQQQIAAQGLKSLGRVGSFYMSGASVPMKVARTLLTLGITPPEHLWHDGGRVARFHYSKQ